MTIKYRPRCFFDVELDGVPAGRIVLELFSDVSPVTCENFRALCTGEKGLGKTTGKPLHYKGVPFHRVVKDFMVQCGDFSSGNGTGGESIYGGTFKDECFDIKHERPFLLSMANRGKDTNGSQFFITTKPAPHLDGVHVVFGHVISGQEVVTSIENQKVDANSRPLADVRVANCGELVPKMKPKEKKRKRAASETTEEGESKSDSGSSSDGSVKKKKKKKKRKKSKKHKKDKKRNGGDKQKIEEGEIVTADETVCSVKADEIPDVPASNFLMRRTSPKDKGPAESKGRGDDEDRRRRSSYQKRQHVSRSGRKIKGRGFMRYRTPSRSRSRSRSYTPPHWRQAQARVVPLSEYQKRQVDKPLDEKADDTVPRQRSDRELIREPEREEQNRDSDVFSQNGDHESRKEGFDRESASKENVSYPIKYPRSYEGSQSKWDTGEKQEWNRGASLPVAEEYARDSGRGDDAKIKEVRKFVEEEVPKSDDDDETKLRNLALSHHLKARSQEYGKSILQARNVEETSSMKKTDATIKDASWNYARGSKERKRASSGSSSSSHHSEVHQVPLPVVKEKSKSPVRGKLIEHSPQPFIPTQQKDLKVSTQRKSSSESPTRLREAAIEAAALPEPKPRTEESARISPLPADTPIKESAPKVSPRRRSSSGSPSARTPKKSHASKSSPKRGKSKSTSPKRSSGRQRKRGDSRPSPRRGRSSSGSPSTRSRAPRSRSSPRRNRRHSYRDGRQARRRSRSPSSDSDADSRRHRHSTASRRRDVPSRFSPRGGRQRRPYRSPRRRSRSDSSSGSRSPYRKPSISRASPKTTAVGDRSRDDGKPIRKSRSNSSERASSPKKDRNKSPVPKIAAAAVSPLPPRKLVQDYGSPTRHSDSSRSSKSPSKTPPDASTALRQAQIIAAYHEEEEEIETKPGRLGRLDTPIQPLLDAGRIGLSKLLPMPDSPPPPPPGVEPEIPVLPPMPAVVSVAPPPGPQLVSEVEGVQDMDLDEDEEEEKKIKIPSPTPLPPAPASLPEEAKPLPAEMEMYTAPLPCSLEDILLPGEIRSDGQPADQEPPRDPSPVEAVSMWKAIPEATQPTVEMSTLELLQKQMCEEAKAESPQAVAVPDKETAPQEEHEQLKGEVPRFPEKKRSPSSSSKERKSPTRSKSREKDRKPRRRSSSREKSHSKGRASRSRSRNRGQVRRKSRSSSRYRRSSRDSRERKRYNRSRSRSRQRDRRRRSPSHSRSRSRSRSRLAGRRRRSKSGSRSRKRSPARGRRPTGSRYRPYIPRRSSSSRRRSTTRKRSRRRSDSGSRSRSRSSSRSS